MGKFEHIIFTRSEVERDIKVLTKHDPPLLIPVCESNGDTRFGIGRGNRLQKFVEDCDYALDNAIMRMEAAWRFRRPNIKKGEVEWHSWFYGQARTTRFFNEARDKRASANKDLNKKKIKQSKREVIRKYDEMVKYRIKRLNSSYYNEIREKYFMFSNVMKEMIYPNFLEELLTRHKI